MTINFHFEIAPPPDINREIIKKAIQKTLELNKSSDVDLTLQFTDDASMRQLNQTYRGIPSTTDVLSFNQDFIDPETNRLYLGDIVISIEKARSQAAKHNHSLTDECALLAIHGTLHLLGYDHADAKQKGLMWDIQKKILNHLMIAFKEDVA